MYSLGKISANLAIIVFCYYHVYIILLYWYHFRSAGTFTQIVSKTESHYLWFYWHIYFFNILLVPWGEVDKSLVKEIVEFIKQEMSYDNSGKPKKPPCSSVIMKRVKRYYRSQRHQCMIKSDQQKRRRQRLLNRRNRLTMVPFLSWHTYIEWFYWCYVITFSYSADTRTMNAMTFFSVYLYFIFTHFVVLFFTFFPN